MACSIPALSRFPGVLSTSLALGVLVAVAHPLSAQTDACKLVKAADVAGLLGGTASATPTPNGTSCAWKTTDPKRKLAVLSYSSQVPGEMAYAGARKGAAGDAGSLIADESGLGDKAFSSTPSFGAAFIMLKGGRVLQLQYYTGARGTAEDRSALRVVAKKAIAAF